MVHAPPLPPRVRKAEDPGFVFLCPHGTCQYLPICPVQPKAIVIKIGQDDDDSYRVLLLACPIVREIAPLSIRWVAWQVNNTKGRRIKMSPDTGEDKRSFKELDATYHHLLSLACHAQHHFNTMENRRQFAAVSQELSKLVCR